MKYQSYLMSFWRIRPGLIITAGMSSPSYPSKVSSPLSQNYSKPSSPTDSQSSLKLSRARMIQNYLEEHVPLWKDDILIQSLFANLPNREVKPEAFKQKYSFWRDLMISMTRERLLSGSVFKITSKELSGNFKRGGIQPICLNGVILEMQNEGLLADASSFQFPGAKRSSIVGGLMNWIYGSFISFIGSESYDSENNFTEHDELEAKVPDVLILPCLLKEQSDLLREYLNSSSHIPLTFEEFHEIVNESRRHEGIAEIVEKDDVLLILKYLSGEGVLNYAPIVEKITENVVLAIKIKGKVTDVDFDIVKLKRIHNRLSYQVKELSDCIAELNESARAAIKVSKDRKMAMYHLKRKGFIEKIQGERLNSLHAVDEILLRINSASDDALILEAYKSGAKTLKELLPNVEDVEEAVEELQGIISDHEVVTQAMNQNISTSDLDEDLEAELKNLMSSDSPKSPLSKDFEGVNELTEKLKEIEVKDGASLTLKKERESPKNLEFA